MIPKVTTLTDPVARQLFLELDDESFCDILLTFVAAHPQTPEEVLFDPDILTRLRQVQTMNPLVFFGKFLTPLRRQFPRKIFVGDLFASMQLIDGLADGKTGMVSPETFMAAGLELAERGGRPGVAPGWRVLSDHYRVRPGELTVVGGQPNHFKSSFLHALAVNLAQREGWTFALFSPEHAPTGELVRSLAERYTQASWWQMSPDLRHDAAAWVSRHFFPIVAPENHMPTIPWILQVAREYLSTSHIRGLIIDPWNEVDHQLGSRQLSETQYISEALSRLRRFGRQHQVHVWLVAHPTKMARAEKGPYAGQYPPPSPYDIAGSSHFYAKADNCLSIWRNTDSPHIDLEVHIQKIRFHIAGKTGLVHMRFRDYQLEEVAHTPDVPF